MHILQILWRKKSGRAARKAKSDNSTEKAYRTFGEVSKEIPNIFQYGFVVLHHCFKMLGFRKTMAPIGDEQ